MGFNELKREAPTPPEPPLPADVSQVYYHLYADVEQDPTLTPALRCIVFCCAYTLYSVEKRDSILQAVLRGAAKNSSDVARAFEKYITMPGRRNGVILQAKQLALEYQQELKSFGLDEISSQIDYLVDRTDANERISIKGFRTHFLYAFSTAVIAALIATSLTHWAAFLTFLEGVFERLMDLVS